MRKTLGTLAALAVMLTACDKPVTIDHGISAEFPVQETLESISVAFGDGTADILLQESGVTSSLEGLTVETISDGGTVVCYKSLAIFTGSWTNLEDLLEESFWQNPSLGWIFTGDFSAYDDSFINIGFVNILRARGLDAGNFQVYAGNGIYDKISGLKTDPVRFTVKVREEER